MKNLIDNIDFVITNSSDTWRKKYLDLIFWNYRVADARCIIITDKEGKITVNITDVYLENFAKYLSLDRSEIKELMKDFVLKGGFNFNVDYIIFS